MRRVCDILELGRVQPDWRRSPRRHRPRRRAERLVRVSALGFLRWSRRFAVGAAEAAQWLGICPATLRLWWKGWRSNRLRPKDRGRPIERTDRSLRYAILSVYDLMGPHVGLPTLQSMFPEVARGELLDLQRRWRWGHGRHRRQLLHTLRWTRPGTVWAADFTTPPRPIEGIYPRILLVRDLASGYQLLALPTPGESAQLVVEALDALFRIWGPPLVIKMDNGTFKAQQVKDCLARHGVQPLYSPPYAPSYNGSIEAGVGSLSVRAHYQAARHDRPGDWTCDDVEAARCQSNETARPHGTYSPVPDHAWSGRFTPTADERSRFVEHSANLTRQEYAHHGWLPMTTSLPHREQASLERIAIARTLIDRGYLMVRRRRIPPPISAWRAQKIS